LQVHQDSLFGGEGSTEEGGQETLVSRGVFFADKETVLRYCRQDSELKLRCLARHLVDMDDKKKRQDWLIGFEAKHGPELTGQLKSLVLDLWGNRS
jgi:hypothetical protein